jgi:hypothetical protein
MSTEAPKTSALDWLPLLAIVAAFLVLSVMLFATAKSGTPQHEPQAIPQAAQNGESMQLTIPVAPSDGAAPDSQEADQTETGADAAANQGLAEVGDSGDGAMPDEEGSGG